METWEQVDGHDTPEGLFVSGMYQISRLEMALDFEQYAAKHRLAEAHYYYMLNLQSRTHPAHPSPDDGQNARTR